MSAGAGKRGRGPLVAGDVYVMLEGAALEKGMLMLAGAGGGDAGAGSATAGMAAASDGGERGDNSGTASALCTSGSDNDDAGVHVEGWDSVASGDRSGDGVESGDSEIEYSP
jgi:hypothetical protein